MSLRVLCAFYQHCHGHVFPRFSFYAYHWFVLTTSMDDAWIVTMLPGSYIFPALSICNQLFPATCFPALFILCHHWLVLVTSMDSIHVASYMFSRVFLLLSVLCFFTFLPRVLIVLENFLSFRLFLTDQFLIQFLSSYRFHSSFQPPLNLFQCI